MSVTNVWIGAVTETTAVVKTKVTGSSVRVAVNEAGSASVNYYGPQSPTTEGIATVEITGLDANTRYEYAVEDDGVLDTSYPGQFKTFPIQGTKADFSYGMATCAMGYVYPAEGAVLDSSRISSSQIFRTVKNQLLARDNGLFFVHGGDMHYYNFGQTVASTLSNHRRVYDDILLQTYQHDLYRNMPLAYVWDDHDYGPNDSDGTFSGRDLATQAYRERVPSYTLPELGNTGSIYHSFQVGRVLFIMSDVRTERSPNDDPQSASKTMLGAAQKAWMESVLTADNGAEALVWVNPSQWISTHTDAWGMFAHERNEMMQLFGDTGWLNRMCINSGDAHALSIDTGGSNTWGGFPVYQFSSLDSEGSAGPSTDTGPNKSGHGQYGIVDVKDNGHTIEITGTGYNWSTEWRSHKFFANVGVPALNLDYSLGRISDPFEPTDDDQHIVNDVTAKRMEGGSARHEVTDGPLSTQDPPDGVGRYDSSVELNVAYDEQLPGQAGWRTHLGTVDEARYPKIRVDLTKQTDIREEVTELDAGDKLIIDNTPEWLPPEPIEAIVQGYTEDLNLFSWDITFNASPASPFTVGETVADVSEAGPATNDRVDTSGCVLVDSVDADDTELVVYTTQDGYVDHARWINSDGPGLLHADEFPFDVRMGGEVVSVEASESFAYDDFERTETDTWGTSSSGDVWTSLEGTDAERSVSGGVASVTITSSTGGSRVQVLETEEVSDCDVKCTFSVSQTATGGSLIPAIVLRHQDGTSYDQYRCRAHFGTDGRVYISIWSPGDPGTTVDSGYEYTAGEKFTVHVRVMGQRLLGRIYPADTEYEPVHWHLDTTFTESLLDTGKIGVLAAIVGSNTNVEFTFEDFEVWNPQRFTVERSINTVTKSHDAGSALSLDNPAVAGL